MEDSPLLVIDLGCLRLSNAYETMKGLTDFDNMWKLPLNESFTATYQRKRSIYLMRQKWYKS